MRYLLILLLLPSLGHALTRTIANGGGNWSANATWVEGAAPTASDDVVATATSGNVTIDTTTCVAKTVILTGYVGTLTATAAKTLTVSGSVTLAAGMTLTGTGLLKILAAGTLTGNGKTWPGSLEINIGAQVLAGGDFVVAGDLNLTNTNVALTGAFNLKVGGNVTNAVILSSAVTTLVLNGTGTISSTVPNGQFNLPIVINTAGTITFGSMFVTSTNTTLTVTSGSVDITTNDTVLVPITNITIPYLGQTWSSYGFTQTTTVSISADWTIPSSLIIWSTRSQGSGQTVTIGGTSHNVTCNKLFMGNVAILNFPNAKTLTVNTGIYLAGFPNGFTGDAVLFLNRCELKSNSPSTAFKLTYLGTPTNSQIYSAKFTDVDASLSTSPIINYDGVSTLLTRTTNIYNRSLPTLCRGEE